MKKLCITFARFFIQPVAVETLGLFRIAVSAFALLQFIILLPDWAWLYGQNSIIPWSISEAIAVTNTPGLLAVFNALQPIGFTENATMYLVTVIYVAALAGLLAGYQTRFMGILAWLMHLLLNTTGNLTAYGVETFTHIALFYCAVLPVGCCLSVDAKRKAIQLPTYLITLSVRVLQLHLCIMYVACGIEKAAGAQWWSGEAIWMAMQQDQFNKINVDWMAQYSIVPKLLCWSTLVIETFYPIGMLWSKTKKVWLMGIISMHLFIALFLGLHLFGLLMMLLNITAFGKHCFVNTFSFSIKGWPFSFVSYKKKWLAKV